VAFRQYRRASSGVDAGVHALLFWLTIITAPVWVPILLIIVIYSHVTSNSPQAQAERATFHAQQQAEQARIEAARSEQERLRREAAEAAAHAPWDALRCEALFARLDQAVLMARYGSDRSAVQATQLRQQAVDHACQRQGRKRQ
jgi:hypothetical protein